MLRVILRKGFVDIRSRKLQSLLLVVVIAVGTMTLTTSLLIRRSTARSFEDFISEVHGGHVWLFGDEQELREIAAGEGVAEAGEPMPALDGGRLLSTSEPYRLSFFATAGEPDSVVPGVLREGRWPSPASAEAVVDRGLAADAGLRSGDTIRVIARGGKADLKIVGLVVPTSRPPYPIADPARVFISTEQLLELAGGTPAYFAAGYVLDDPERASEFVSQLMSAGFAGNGRSWQAIRDDIVEENDAVFILLGVFAAFALVAAVFIIANAIVGQVQVQQRDIGLLKAAGMTPGQVAVLLVTQLAALAIVASGLGVAAGWAAAPQFLGSVDRWLGFSSAVAPRPRDAALTVAGIALVAAICAAIPAAKAGRRSTVESIRLGRQSARTGTSRGARFASQLGLPQPIVIGVKDLFARRLAAWLTIAAVAVAAAAVIATVTIETTLNNAFDQPALLGLKPFDLQIEPVVPHGQANASVAISNAELESIVSGEPAIDSYMGMAWQAIVVGGASYSGYALGGDFTRFRYAISQGRMMEPGGDPAFEVMIGIGLSRRAGLTVGDSGTFSLASAPSVPHQFEVVGVYAEGDNDGLVMTFALADLRRIVPGLDPFAYGLLLREGSDPRRVAASLTAASGERAVVANTLHDAEADVRRIRSVIRPIMLSLSAFLIGMVSISLFSTLSLSVRERTRELGLLKAIGFTPGGVIVSTVSSAVVLASIGAVIGAPAGWLFTRFVFAMSAGNDGYDAGAVIQTPTPLWFLLLFAAALCVAALGSALPARHAARLGVSTALRYE